MGVWKRDMRFWKAFGGFLCFIGCLAALAGILATALPMIDNDQIRRIIQSFSVKSQDAMLNAVNGAILVCLRYNYWLFGGGAALLLIGGLIKTVAGKALYNAYHSEQESTAPVNKRVNVSTPTQPKAPVKTAAEPPFTSRTNAGISPYTAAQYGKALTSTGAQASDIAKKYLPRSIIPTEDEPDELFARPATTLNGTDTAQAPATAAMSVALPITAGNVERTDVILCPACGAENPANLSFCGQCGSKLPARLTILATEAKQKAKEATDAEAYQKPRNTYDELSQTHVAGTVQPAIPAKQQVESIFSVPVEPIAAKQATHEPLPSIDELLTGSEWGRSAPDTARTEGNRFDSAISRQGDTVEARFQPPYVEDIRLGDEWKQTEAAGYASTTRPMHAGILGEPVTEYTAIRQPSRHFHPPVAETVAHSESTQTEKYTTQGNNAQYWTETIPAVKATVPGTNGAANYAAQLHIVPTPPSATASTTGRTLPPIGKAHIVSTIHNAAFEDTSQQEPAVTGTYPTSVGFSEETVRGPISAPAPVPSAPASPALPQTNRPRIISTMGKKSSL